MPAPNLEIGFIGAGAMGAGMISSLRRNGFGVTFFVRATQRGGEIAVRLRSSGATQAPDLATIGRAGVVILCLPDSSTVESILGDNADLADAMRPGTIVLDCSTSHPESTRRLASTLAVRNVVLLDAALTGSRAQAEAGTLSVLGAGPQDAFTRVTPVMRGFASRIFYLGGSGAGHAAKLMNNFLAQLALAGLCEIWPLMDKYGIEPSALFEAISASGGNSAVFQGMFPRFRKRDFTLNFAQRLACKDVRYVTELARQFRLPCPMAETLLSVQKDATARGYGDQDMTSLLRYYEEVGGRGL